MGKEGWFCGKRNWLKEKGFDRVEVLWYKKIKLKNRGFAKTVSGSIDTLALWQYGVGMSWPAFRGLRLCSKKPYLPP